MLSRMPGKGVFSYGGNLFMDWNNSREPGQIPVSKIKCFL
jgi:hypothetical protein